MDEFESRKSRISSILSRNSFLLKVADKSLVRILCNPLPFLGMLKVVFALFTQVAQIPLDRNIGLIGETECRGVCRCALHEGLIKSERKYMAS